MSIKYTERLKDAGIEPSVGSVGDSYQRPRRDHQRTLQSRSDLAARAVAQLRGGRVATLEWVDWFNNKRLLEPIGNIPPAEAEARYYAQTAGHAMAA